jgi:hypothetical protein
MFKAGELEAISMALEPQFRELEQRIMSDIVRRISINGEITRAADWQVTRLAQLGESKREIKKAIKDTLSLSTKEVNHLYKDIICKGYERDAELYKYKGKTQIPFADNHELQQLIGAVSDQTNSELKNITQSLGFAKRGADGKLTFTPVADYYQKTLDSAMLDISSGAFDYNTVLKRTVKEMTNSGLRTVDYATGHSNRVDVAARRAVMTGMSQLTAKVNDSNAEQLGTDTFEVTAHGGARPEHQEWQGRWYTKDELESICGLGEVTGLCGANCYHDYYPVVPGISEPTYTPEQIEEFNRKENESVEYNGKKYTKYEATQRQRQLETTMRAQRQEIKLLKEGGASEDDLIAARSRYRGTSAEYARFSKAMDLPQQRERVTVDGLGNIGQDVHKPKTPESPVPSVKKDENNVNDIDKSKNSDIIEESKAYRDTVEYISALDIESVVPKAFEVIPSENEIISRLSGGDLTNGSCTSLAFAYAGNKGGLDVLDFRGGKSCEFFSKTANIKSVTSFTGVKSFVEKNTNDFNAVTELLKKVEPNKEYILVTGKHTAVIRKAEKGFEYLNMQDPNPKNNCFKPLTTKSLKSRFACQKSYKSYGQELQASSILFDRESLSSSVEFKDILRYINTNDSKQMKGVKGHDR